MDPAQGLGTSGYMEPGSTTDSMSGRKLMYEWLKIDGVSSLVPSRDCGIELWGLIEGY